MMAETELELGVSDFVALLNQTLDYAYPSVVISGELANLRISRNRWLYFDLKDELSTVKFFGTVQQLPGPLEDGMLLKVLGQPRLHHQYGFSVNVRGIRPAGEGTIRRAAQLLRAKLAAEGLFDERRKRPLPYPPRRVGLITSQQSAACADFIKIINARWQGLDIDVLDTQVQGEAAPEQIVTAIERFNTAAEAPDVLVLIRGGGSAEDLAAFNHEAVTRAVAASRIPMLVAIGHETDVSLAELAADRRASTPSNAAELLVPDRREALRQLREYQTYLRQDGRQRVTRLRTELLHSRELLHGRAEEITRQARRRLAGQHQLLEAFNPQAVLRRGYAVVRHAGQPLRGTQGLQPAAIVDVQLATGGFRATVTETVNAGNSRKYHHE